VLSYVNRRFGEKCLRAEQKTGVYQVARQYKPASQPDRRDASYIGFSGQQKGIAQSHWLAACPHPRLAHRANQWEVALGGSVQVPDCASMCTREARGTRKGRFGETGVDKQKQTNSVARSPRANNTD
jgi:hypothetical protein